LSISSPEGASDNYSVPPRMRRPSHESPPPPTS
jgi:hypothetical protein